MALKGHGACRDDDRVHGLVHELDDGPLLQGVGHEGHHHDLVHHDGGADRCLADERMPKGLRTHQKGEEPEREQVLLT